MLPLPRKPGAPKAGNSNQGFSTGLQKEGVGLPTPQLWVLASKRVRELIYVILSYQVRGALLEQS